MSGFSSGIFASAKRPFAAVPTTSSAASGASPSHSTLRITAESSTTSTRIGGINPFSQFHNRSYLLLSLRAAARPRPALLVLIRIRGQRQRSGIGAPLNAPLPSALPVPPACMRARYPRRASVVFPVCARRESPSASCPAKFRAAVRSCRRPLRSRLQFHPPASSPRPRPCAQSHSSPADSPDAPATPAAAAGPRPLRFARADSSIRARRTARAAPRSVRVAATLRARPATRSQTNDSPGKKCRTAARSSWINLALRPAPIRAAVLALAPRRPESHPGPAIRSHAPELPPRTARPSASPRISPPRALRRCPRCAPPPAPRRARRDCTPEPESLRPPHLLTPRADGATSAAAPPAPCSNTPTAEFCRGIEPQTPRRTFPLAQPETLPAAPVRPEEWPCARRPARQKPETPAFPRSLRELPRSLPKSRVHRPRKRFQSVARGPAHPKSKPPIRRP